MAEGARTESAPQVSFDPATVLDGDDSEPTAASAGAGTSGSGGDKTPGTRKTRKPKESSVSTEGINWPQTTAVVHFVARYGAAEAEDRRFVLDVFGLTPQKGSTTAGGKAGSDPQAAAVVVADEALDLARRLSPAGGLIAAWRLYDSLVEKVMAGPLDWKDGIAITTQLSGADQAVLREFVRIINVCCASDISVKRSGGSTSETVGASIGAVIEAQELHSADRQEFVNDLIALWS